MLNPWLALEAGADAAERAGQVRRAHEEFVSGYFENPTPVNGAPFTEIARGTAEDVERAIDAAHEAAADWGRKPVTERAAVLQQIAQRTEEHLEERAVAESWENDKPVREALATDIPLAIDHFRCFAGAIRAQEGSLSEIDEDTVAYHFHEPLGVVGQIIPWNFPIPMAAWKLAPALAAGNAVVPRLPRARRLRRLQAVRHRPGEPPDDARPLPADEEPAGELRAEEAGILLMPTAEQPPDLTGRTAAKEPERVALTQGRLR